ncbi:DUF6443 domain-containing protein [Puia dinghuensis]|uniref:DUF6443 domain-containing protein n=1 Tax=Puia dinghuensis TaxID=1792502 RepID=A0A8J2U6X5_9BACT|nr:DUF6443 domain-containing protein [Puia dinghuensis]GGA82750.1 hypothetical protein GCM10011511_02210 [Puia dinghuensis]
MQPLLVRLLHLGICCLLGIPVYSQYAQLSGPNHVQPGETDYYTIVSWPQPVDPSSNIIWQITGGTVLYSDQYSCQVQWGSAPMIGQVYVYEDLGGQQGFLSVQIGDPQVTVSPAIQQVDYGGSAQTLTGGVSTLDAITSTQWQGSSDGVNWSVISSASGNTYTPPATQAGYYRFLAVVNGNTYYSNAANVSITPLTPGTISLGQQPTYNSVPTVTNTPASGGMCYASDRVYTWEASVDGQPWTVIGTGVNYPSAALITGKTYIHRKVSCGGTTLVSNTLYIVPTYTSVDYENLNYVRTIDVHVTGISTWYQADQLAMTSKYQSTTYLDGLGRSIQKVDKAASYSGGAWVDLVQPIVYDAAGRTTQKYLPYPTADNPGKYKSANVFTEQASFVTGKFGEPSGAPTYAQIQYDNSPLNRVMEMFASGQSWGGSGVGQSMAYDFNTAAENVRIWQLGYSASTIPTTTGSYATGSLYKSIATDEKNHQVITYTDFSGNQVLKKVQELESGSGLTGQHAGWECTYYVYDDLNQLRFTITPKVVTYLDNNGWSLTQQLVNDLCYVYGYDTKGRTISKKQPGIGETDYVYDQRNRPVFVQDANGLANSQWQVSQYDPLDRVISTGMLNLSISQASLQTNVDANTGQINVISGAQSLSDPVFYTRQTGVASYVGSHSVTFDALTNTSFVSEDGASFVGYVDPNLVNIVSEVVAVADNPIPSSGTYIPLTYAYYDDYSQSTRNYTTADNSLFDPSTNQQALPLPAQASLRTRGLVTCSKVKVITNPADLTQGSWQEADTYYDEFGRVIQVQNTNALGGTDITTSRYDFQGKLWGSCVKHMAGASTQFTVVSKNSYDQQGRLTDLAKNFNNTFFKPLVNYTYDEYGKMVKKRLAPGYTPPNTSKTEMESLQYDYNIQGWLIGINKNYALSTNTYDQWNQYFGLYLGYDNRDNQFAAVRLDGKITGAIWKSQGDNSMRKYDNTYDAAGRFTSALYNQRKTPADSWSNATVDLSEYVTYADGNGNIGTMKHMGIVPGVTSGIVVDDLLYNYGTSTNPNTNQLSRVDERANFAGNGQLYDFANGSNAAGTNDYQYDPNGNLLQDLNKGVTDGGNGGVVYNYLNKPVKITIAGKSIIQYTYDATGIKLSKTVTNIAVTPNTSTTTTYADEFVYQDNSLQFVLFEEGRLKLITPVNTPQAVLNAGTAGTNFSSTSQGVFEYFVKDQLSNTRMVLTEEAQREVYTATMELSSTSDPNLGTDEAKLFGKVDPNTGAPAPDNELVNSRTDRPSTWSGNTSAKVALLTATGQKVGPNLILKVSAGDIISAQSSYFYLTNDPTGSSTGVSDVLTSLLGALLGNKASALTKMNSSLINTNLSASGSDFSNFITNQSNTGSANAPNAFLSVAFFDEQFNFIPYDLNAAAVGSNSLRVSSANNQNASLVLQQKAPKNGWVFVYLSNESNQNVYFDNFTVTDDHGAISEETHYYAFGQKIAGLCTSAFKKLPNKFHYQGDYSEEEENTLWNEFDLRMYDPQIGRWTGADPYDEFASPYVGMGNDPVNTVDENGGDVDPSGFLGAGLGALGGATFMYFVARNNHLNWWETTGAIIGGALGGSGLGYGLGEALFVSPREGGGHFGAQVRAFYKSLFTGDEASVDAGYTAVLRTRNGTKIYADIWGQLKDFMPKLEWETFTRTLIDFDSEDPATRTVTTAIVKGITVNRTTWKIPDYPASQRQYLETHADRIQRILTSRVSGLGNDAVFDRNGNPWPDIGPNLFPVWPGNTINFDKSARGDRDPSFHYTQKVTYKRRVLQLFREKGADKIVLSKWKLARQ